MARINYVMISTKSGCFLDNFEFPSFVISKIPMIIHSKKAYLSFRIIKY